MLPVRHLCLQTVVGSKQGHAPFNVLLSYEWLGVRKGMLPVRHLCLQTLVGSKQGHAPCKTLMSSNCGWD